MRISFLVPLSEKIKNAHESLNFAVCGHFCLFCKSSFIGSKNGFFGILRVITDFSCERLKSFYNAPLRGVLFFGFFLVILLFVCRKTIISCLKGSTKLICQRPNI